MRFTLFSALLLPTLLQATAPTVPEGGMETLAPDALLAARALGRAEFGKPVLVDLPDAPAPRGWRVQVKQTPKVPWGVQIGVDVAGEIKAGDRLLALIDVRCVESADPAGQGMGSLMVELRDDSSTKIGHDAFRFGKAWQTVTVPLLAGVKSLPGGTTANLRFGDQVQTVEIARLRLVNYGADFPMARLPRPTVHYPGREPDAPWRKEALARIEQHRVSPFTVRVEDAQGHPVAGAEVHAVLRRHSFGFGSAIKARSLLAYEGYRKVVEDNFSRIAFENDLKPEPWQKGAANTHKDYRREYVDQASAWLRERGIEIRGHYLCWGPWQPWSEALKDQPGKIREGVLNQIRDIVPALEGRVMEWDAVNHPAGWNDPRRTVDLAIGPGFYEEVFREARKLTRVPLWINEDQVVRPGFQQENFYAILQDLLKRGAPVDGIGNQAHFHSSFLPGPEDILRNSDRFAALVPRLQFTEFDVITNGDEQLQADWLRDCLILTYSHPAYTGFILWVFWEGTGYKIDAALWRQDWSEKPAGTVWRQLTREAWRTDVHGPTAPDGAFTSRGHHGLYDITVTLDGNTRKFTHRVEPKSAPLQVAW